MLAVAALLAFVRVVRGPTLPDRVVAIDLIGVLIVGLIVVTPPPRASAPSSTWRLSSR